jgi:cell division septation protein DedD
MREAKPKGVDMEDKNELNDILIKSDDKSGDNNMKNLLLFAAITLLIFFVGVLAFKLVSEDEPKNTKKSVLPQKPVTKKSDLFEELPTAKESEEAAKDNLDDMIKRIKESKTTEDKTLESDNIIEEKADSNVPAPAPVTMPVTQNKAKVAPKPVAKPVAKPVIKDKAYYIQVASLSKYEPNKIFLSKIEKTGLKYKVVNRMINGNLIKRVYVGPFTTRDEANKQLTLVKQKITSSAFVIKD